ncbi:MAG TPA: phosphomethylpyrimidine synthase ThiC [Candidatus Aerophobetes bacterium]|uniref:Phosphomethylpyrimidine synthase n=1 Tax=Aerophobetes bacterium TaxID=2030807 RepID=A0A7V0MZM6_UNCAE|nr:phosphomethylpyrimidine synthase ThiC [Candidatus Aerophobetes bacterium]
MTQLEHAKKGNITSEMKIVSQQEKVKEGDLIERIARGEVIIPKNLRRSNLSIVGIGKGLRTKINTNIGTSPDLADIKYEIEKLKIAEKVGTDTVMDLSTGGDLDKIRRTIIKETHLPLGTVPIYQAAVESIAEEGNITRMNPDKIFEVIEKQAEDGVDFMTVHCGLTLSSLERLKKEGRIGDIVSRGGAFLTTWMVFNERENPLYEQFDRLLELARKYDVTLSLGDGLRPGCIADSTDRAQIQELIILGELAQRALDAGVQVMIEGPGHIPFKEIEANILLEKKLCHNAPFYVLGPVVTDIAPGYDHITSAIGGSYAASVGADFLCYVTPGEHLRLPTIEDVREGVIAARIAAHVGDLSKNIKGAAEWDLKMAKSREKRNWKEQIDLSIDPEFARKMRDESKPKFKDVCTMCGEFCALKLVEKALKGKKPLILA